MSFQIPKRWEQWASSLIAATVSGFATSICAALSIPVGAVLGEKVPTLEGHQILHIGVSGAIVGAVMYLRQSPVPPQSTGDTQLFNKSGTGAPEPPQTTKP